MVADFKRVLTAIFKENVAFSLLIYVSLVYIITVSTSECIAASDRQIRN